MNAETLFSLCGNAVLPGWVLLILAPRWKWTTAFIASVLLPGLLGVVYLGLIVANVSKTEGSFRSLAGVAALFQNPYLLLAGWVHYLAFDLFVGCWEVRDAQRTGVRHWFVIPCLVLTFLLGPAGLLAYFLVRAATTHQVLIGADKT